MGSCTSPCLVNRICILHLTLSFFLLPNCEDWASMLLAFTLRTWDNLFVLFLIWGWKSVHLHTTGITLCLIVGKDYRKVKEKNIDHSGSVFMWGKFCIRFRGLLLLSGRNERKKRALVNIPKFLMLRAKQSGLQVGGVENIWGRGVTERV